VTGLRSFPRLSLGGGSPKGIPALALALRSADPGVLAQGLRFALAGSTVALVYLTTTTVLADAVGVPFQAALAIGFCIGLIVHFTLQRLFVWNHREEFALPLHHQAGRYLTVAAVQYGVTVAATSLLPAALDIPTEIVYLATVAVLICTNFLVFRHGIFHAKAAVPEQDRKPRALCARERTSRALHRLPRGVRGRLSTPSVIDGAIAMLAVLLIASPLLFTHDGFAPDFTNDIWLSSYQQHVIAAHLHPTLFLQSQQLGVFNPFFAFYGGTLFALTGALAVILGGSTILAFEVVTLAAIAAAYGGIFWLARQLGVRRMLAHAPAVVFVTSAYYITDLYGRGAWAEFMAVSALPLMMAAALRVVRGRWRVGPVVCLVAASTVFSGSHKCVSLGER
jgi:putative flippase GtrA